MPAVNQNNLEVGRAMNRKLRRWVAFLQAMSGERICLSCWAEFLQPYLTRLICMHACNIFFVVLAATGRQLFHDS